MAFIESGKSFDKERHYKKMKTKMEDIVQYQLRIPFSLHKKLRKKCLEESISIQKLLLNYVSKYCKEQ